MPSSRLAWTSSSLAWCVRGVFNQVLVIRKRVLLLGRTRKVNPSLPQHCQMDQNEEGGNSHPRSLRFRFQAAMNFLVIALNLLCTRCITWG